MSGASIGGKTPTYLDVNYLRPGDVVLSRGSDITSRALARFSGGQYSHAALVLDSHSLFEADDCGVGFTHVPTVLVKVAGGHRKWWEFSDGRRVQVLRHPDLAGRYQDTIGPPGLRLLDAVSKAVAPYHGQPYSHLERLAGASQMPAGLQPALRAVLRLWQYADWARGQDRNLASCVVGLFCSEVIVEAYQQLGVALFDDKRPAGVVSPNDLGRAPSKLTEPVTGAVVTERQVNDARLISRLDAGELAWRHRINLLAREEYLPPIVNFNEEAANLAHSVAGLVQSVESQVARQAPLLCDIEVGIQGLVRSAHEGDMHEALIRQLDETFEQFQRDRPFAEKWLERRDECGVQEVYAYGRTLVNFAAVTYLYAATEAADARRQRRLLRQLQPGAHRARGIVDGSRDLHRLARLARSGFYLQLAAVERLYQAHDKWLVGRQQVQLQENFEFCDIELPVGRFTDLDEFVAYRIKEQCAATSDEVLIEVATSEATRRAFEGVTDRVSWLRDNVEVTFPESRWMRIGVRGLSRDLLRLLADALAAAYRQDAIRRADQKQARQEQNREQAERWAESLISALKRVSHP